MTRIVRAPSVEDYARMTQAARLSAARLVEEQTALIEQRRAALRADDQARTELTAAVVRHDAQVIYDRLEHEPAEVCGARLEAAGNEADGWTTRRRAERETGEQAVA